MQVLRLFVFLTLCSGSFAFQAFLSCEERTFADSLEKCRQIGGELVSVHVLQENDVLVDLLLDDGLLEAWLGLQIQDSTLFWTDITIPTFDNFPASVNTNTNGCGSVFQDGTWQIFDCNEELYSFCTVEELSDIITPPPVNTNPLLIPDALPDGTVANPALLVVNDNNNPPVKYVRCSYKHWISQPSLRATFPDKNIDTRGFVLIRDSDANVAIGFGNNNRVISGSWLSVYDNVRTTSASVVQIDHVVALKNAHISGGWQWNPEKKQAYANDLFQAYHLLTVTATTNRKKSSKSPDQWLPPDTSFHCQYAQIWTLIKMRWQLTVTSPELAKLQQLLNTCNTAPVTVGTSSNTSATTTYGHTWIGITAVILVVLLGGFIGAIICVNRRAKERRKTNAGIDVLEEEDHIQSIAYIQMEETNAD